MTFFIGYSLAKKNFFEGKGNKLLFGGIFQFIICVVLRLVARRFMDGTVFYDLIIVPVTHAGISISALSLIKWIDSKTRVVEYLGRNRLFSHIDSISIYVYVSHDWFIGSIPLVDMNINAVFLYPIYALTVFTTATVLWYVFEKIGNLIEKKIIQP